MFTKTIILVLITVLASCGTASDYIDASNCMLNQQGLPIQNCQKILEGK